MNPLDLMPEFLLNEEDVERLDTIIDKVAANSRWSNNQVAWAIARLLHLIVGDGKWRDGRRLRKWHRL